MTEPDFDSALAGASADVQHLAERTRAFVLDVLPADILETVGGTDVGYGWTAGYKGVIAVISVYERWVNLGLPDGVGLPDPGGLMQGTGKRHRHVRISSVDDLERPALRDLLEASLQGHPRPAAP